MDSQERATNAKDKHRKAIDIIAVVSLFHLRFQKKKRNGKRKQNREKVDILREKKKKEKKKED